MTSLLLLADSGYGGQAMVLARTLFEDTVVAWWCEGRQTTELLGLMESHEKSVALLLQRESPGRGDFETLATVPVLKEEDLAALSEEDNVDVRRARGL